MMISTKTLSNSEQHDKQINNSVQTKSNTEIDLLNRADFVERLLIDAADTKQKRRTSNASSEQSEHIDRLLEDENNDWFFEKILAKFENLQSKRVDRQIDTPDYGVERIIERRYYIKKSRPIPKRDQITSTSDLIETQRKYRQHSNSSEHRSCSQCSSVSTPTFVEDFREQSDTLRHEITDLKNEIELLQNSQRDFFQKLQTHFQIKTNPIGEQQFKPPAISPQRSPPSEQAPELPIPLTTKAKSRSISTESHPSSSLSSEATTIKQPIVRNTKPPLSTITQFTATKNPSIPQAPIVHSIRSSVVSNTSTPIAEFTATNQPTNLPQIPSLKSQSPSLISVRITSKPPTPSAQNTVTSKSPSVYESELAHRRVLSPHSQIVASSAYTLESLSESSTSSSSSSSSSSSTGSNTPVHHPPQTTHVRKIPPATLLDSELKDLVHYSSQLEITGFPAAKPKLTTQLDQYVAQITSRTFNRTRQLDKYDLEIKPQEILTPSAPLLMPPLDISP